MAPKYNIVFIPHFKDRKKISPLRSKLCKITHTTQALHYPIHMSLISGGFYVKNYTKFEQALKRLCKNEKPIHLKTEKFTAVLPERFWTGIHILRTNEITTLQQRLQKLRNEFTSKKGKHEFRPLHITLAFPAKVDELKKMTCPVNSMILDRVTIIKKETESAPYKIFQHGDVLPTLKCGASGEVG